MRTAALCAKTIRAELKTVYPDAEFRVRSETYSGGNSVNVDWTDGPASVEVKKLLDKYEYGSFDGMTDCYNLDNLRDDIPQTKYLFCNRKMSDSVRTLIGIELGLHNYLNPPDEYTQNHWINQKFRETSYGSFVEQEAERAVRELTATRVLITAACEAEEQIPIDELDTRQA